jgi:hypothetical protein
MYRVAQASAHTRGGAKTGRATPVRSSLIARRFLETAMRRPDAGSAARAKRYPPWHPTSVEGTALHRQDCPVVQGLFDHGRVRGWRDLPCLQSHAREAFRSRLHTLTTLGMMLLVVYYLFVYWGWSDSALPADDPEEIDRVIIYEFSQSNLHEHCACRQIERPLRFVPMKPQSDERAPAGCSALYPERLPAIQAHGLRGAPGHSFNLGSCRVTTSTTPSSTASHCDSISRIRRISPTQRLSSSIVPGCFSMGRG